MVRIHATKNEKCHWLNQHLFRRTSTMYNYSCKCWLMYYCQTTTKGVEGRRFDWPHYNDVIMSAMGYQIISLTIVYSTVYSRRRSKKHQSSASLAYVRGIHRWPVNSPHKGPVPRNFFSFDDVIMPARARTDSRAISQSAPVCTLIIKLNTFRPTRNEQHFADDISNIFSSMKMFEFRLK